MAVDTDGKIDMSTWFDKNHFISTLRQDCPQMQIIDSSKSDLAELAIKRNYIKLDPRELVKFEDLFRGHTLEKP